MNQLKVVSVPCVLSIELINRPTYGQQVLVCYAVMRLPYWVSMMQICREVPDLCKKCQTQRIRISIH